MKTLCVTITLALNLQYLSGQTVGQSLLGTVWQHDSEKNIFIAYKNDKVYDITDYTKSDYSKGGITVSQSIFGFYDSCNVPSIDKLKQTGAFYFELDASDFENEEIRKLRTYQNCGQLNIQLVGKDTLMNIYYSSRQQFVSYKKIKSLPKHIDKFLRSKGIRIK